MSYQHILLVTDLLSDADVVAQKAKRIVDNRPDAKLSVLHIVKDTMVGFGYELVPASSLYDEIDLLVIGRHERHGIAAWLSGATADNILPNVPCDSLVVRLDKPVNK